MHVSEHVVSRTSPGAEPQRSLRIACFPFAHRGQPSCIAASGIVQNESNLTSDPVVGLDLLPFPESDYSRG
jgi:hypothetical protein